MERGGWTARDLGGRPALETVLRARRAVGADSYVGAVVSDRTSLGGSLWNRLGGIDGRARWSDKLQSSSALLGSTTRDPDGASRLAPAGVATLEYGSEHVAWEGWGDLVGREFRAENGFVPQTDRIGGGTSLELTAYPAGRIVSRVSVEPVDGEVATTMEGVLRFVEVDPSVGVSLGNGGHAGAEFAHTGERFSGAWLEYDRVGAEVWIPWAQALSTSVELETGTGALYDPAAPAVGWRDDLSATVELAPLDRLSLSLSGSYERFLRDGDALYGGLVSRARLEAYASRQVGSRLILDRDSFTGTVRGEALLSWESSPGSALYLGGSRTVGDPLAQHPTPVAPAWQVFAKASWVFSS